METKVLDGINGLLPPDGNLVGRRCSRSGLPQSFQERTKTQAPLGVRFMAMRGSEMQGEGAKGPTVIYEVSKTLYTPTRQRGSLAPRNPLFFFALPSRYSYIPLPLPLLLPISISTYTFGFLLFTSYSYFYYLLSFFLSRTLSLSGSYIFLVHTRTYLHT